MPIRTEMRMSRTSISRQSAASALETYAYTAHNNLRCTLFAVLDFLFRFSYDQVITDDSRLLWLRDLSGMTKNLTLLFPNVTLADMGDYACRVGSAGHEFAVRVTVSEYAHAQEEEPSTTNVVDEQPRTKEGTEPQSEAEHALDPTSVGRRRAFWTQTFVLLEAALGLVLVLVLAAFAWKRGTRCRSLRHGFEGLVNEAADVDDEEVAGTDKTTLQMHQL